MPTYPEQGYSRGRFFAGILRTGRIIINDLQADDGDCQMIVSEAGTISCTVPLPLYDELTDTKIRLGDLVVPGQAYLAYEEIYTAPDGTESSKILNAGPIWGDELDFDTNKVKLSAAGIWSMFDYRFVLPVIDETYPTKFRWGKVEYTDLSYATIAKRLVEQATNRVGGELPIYHGVDVAGTYSRTYAAADMTSVAHALSLLAGVRNGPDLVFRPYRLNDTHIAWDLLAGDPEYAPSETHVFLMDGPSPSAFGGKMGRSAKGLVTHAYGVVNPSGGGEPLTNLAFDLSLLGETSEGIPMVNNVPNPSSEGADTDFWAQWEVPGLPSGAVATLTSDTAQKHSGARSIRIQTDVTNTGPLVVRCTPWATWRGDYGFNAGVWVRADVAGVSARVVVGDTTANGGAHSMATGTETLLTAGVWTHLELEQSIHPSGNATGFTWMGIRFETSDFPGTATVWIDDAHFASSPLEASLNNGDFSGAVTDTAETKYGWTGDENGSGSARWAVEGYPRMEVAAGVSDSIQNPSSLYDDLQATVHAGQFLTTTFTFSALRDQAPRLVDIEPGDYVRLHTEHDDWIDFGEEFPMGGMTFRATSISVKLNDAHATLNCQPVRTAAP